MLVSRSFLYKCLSLFKGTRIGMVEYPAPAISDDLLEYASLNKEIDKTVLHQIFGGGGRKVTALGKVLRIS